MPEPDLRMRLLSPYQRRAFRKYESFLEAAALNPDRVLSFAEEEPTAVVPILRNMTDQVVRSEVVLEYTWVDMELDRILIRHFFGVGKKLLRAKRRRPFKTLEQILRNLYIHQKLTIVRRFKEVPKGIVSKISAMNDLRNGLAHTFFLEDLSPSKRTYRGNDIFKLKGCQSFRKDAWEIRCFFTPWLREFLPDELRPD